MKAPRKSDLTVNTIIAAIAAAFVCNSLREYMFWFPVFTAFYSLIDYLKGDWEEIGGKDENV